jgi:hypothetical protein
VAFTDDLLTFGSNRWQAAGAERLAWDVVGQFATIASRPMMTLVRLNAFFGSSHRSRQALLKIAQPAESVPHAGQARKWFP